MRNKKPLVVGLLAALAFGTAAAVGAAGSPSPVPVVVETDPAPFKAPTGPSMSPAAAAQIATSEAARAGEASPSGVTQAKGTFAQMQAILDPHGTTAAGPETREWLASAAYLTVMHGSFTSGFVAPGTEPLKGGVMAVITDAHSGWVEGQYIGQHAPASADLTAIPATQPVAAASRIAAGVTARRGEISGRLVQSNALPGAGSERHGLGHWPVVIGRGKLPLRLPSGGAGAEHRAGILKRVTTGPGGRFVVHMPPGRYVVAGVWRAGSPSAGEICEREHVRVRADRRVKVVVGCNGP